MKRAVVPAFLKTSLAILAIVTFLAASAAAQSAKPSSSAPTALQTPGPREIALTFDDLPSHGPLPQKMTRVDIANSIIHALQAAGVPPTYGFVNAKRIDEDAASEKVLELWRDAGFPLGNHTFSHMNLDSNTLEAFEQDLLAGEPILKKYMDGQDWRWLRYPFLREGDTPEKHRGIVAFLKQHGYRVAEVTLSYADYNYNDPYARCLAKNDEQGVEELKRNYLGGADDSLSQGHDLSQLVYGRDIPQIMLLHIGGFETVMFPKFLALLKERGYKVVSLADAAADPAYAVDPDLPSNWDGTFLQQAARAKHIQIPPTGENRFAKIDALCR